MNDHAPQTAMWRMPSARTKCADLAFRAVAQTILHAAMGCAPDHRARFDRQPSFDTGNDPDRILGKSR
jgi:hypothetical protein